MTEKLKPCPFCGGEALLKDDLEYFGAKVICLECGATKVLYDFSKENSIKGVIKEWNRRAE